MKLFSMSENRADIPLEMMKGLFMALILIDQDCDVFIAGESDNCGFRFAQENGIPMIETSHEISENPGLRHFTGILAQEFPDVSFNFFENTCVWKIH